MLVALMGSCIPATDVIPLPSETAIPTDNPTPTVVWFPPTPTWTPIPTIEPTATPELRPGIGGIVFHEDFSTADGWTLGPLPQGNIGL